MTEGPHQRPVPADATMPPAEAERRFITLPAEHAAAMGRARVADRLATRLQTLGTLTIRVSWRRTRRRGILVAWCSASSPTR